MCPRVLLRRGGYGWSWKVVAAVLVAEIRLATLRATILQSKQSMTLSQGCEPMMGVYRLVSIELQRWRNGRGHGARV